jgi:epoxyqueuosine reductase
MGGWVFGCDICQQVCPWNERFAAEGGEAAFQAPDDRAAPLLLEDLALTPQAFNRKFKGSPVKRSKRRGYLRNICVALGNGRQKAALPALIRILRDEPEPLVRAHAAWAVGQIGGAEALVALQSAQEAERDEMVLAEISAALERF